MRDDGGGGDNDGDDAGSGGGRQADEEEQADETHGKLLVSRENGAAQKRQEFKVLAHHGRVTRNGNLFLQAANRLHLCFFVICVVVYRRHRFLHGNCPKIPTYQGSKSLDHELGIITMLRTHSLLASCHNLFDIS